MDQSYPHQTSAGRAGQETGMVWNAEYNVWTLTTLAKLQVDSSTEGFPEVATEVASNPE